MKLSDMGGFSSYADMELIASYIPTEASVLELGAGYGRCLDYFVQKGHKGKLTGVEYALPLVEYLKEKFEDKAEILNADIKKLQVSSNYDVVLWMWSGIIDFSKEEQLDSCKRIYTILNEGGRFFIDIPRMGIQTIANHLDSQNLVLTTDYGVIHAFIPNDMDMENIKNKAGFSKMVKIDYATATDKKRTVYMLEK
jgi:SAM-dependent methyltransferase